MCVKKLETAEMSLHYREFLKTFFSEGWQANKMFFVRNNFGKWQKYTLICNIFYRWQNLPKYLWKLKKCQLFFGKFLERWEITWRFHGFICKTWLFLFTNKNNLNVHIPGEKLIQEWNNHPPFWVFIFKKSKGLTSLELHVCLLCI